MKEDGQEADALAELPLPLDPNRERLEKALRLADRAEELAHPFPQKAGDLKAKIPSELDRFKTGKGYSGRNMRE